MSLKTPMCGSGCVRLALCCALSLLCGTACRRDVTVAPPRPSQPVPPSKPVPSVTPPAVVPAPEIPSQPDVVLDPSRREMPGLVPTPYLYYRNPAARGVRVCGIWDQWRVRHAMTRRDDLWILDVRPLGLAPGRYEFKFIVEGEWETGANRVLAIGEQRWLERPPDMVLDARIDELSRINLTLVQPVASLSNVVVSIDPAVPVRGVSLRNGRDRRALAGFMACGDYVVFCFDSRANGVRLASNDTVSVAGTFNGWNSQSWRLDWVGNGVWQKVVSASDAQVGRGEGRFKYVVNGSRWIGPRADAPNAMIDEEGNMNFRLSPEYSQGSVMEIDTGVPLALSNVYTVVISNLVPRLIRHPVRPGAVLNRMQTRAPLGVSLDRNRGRACLSLFAPRAAWVDLLVSDKPDGFARLSASKRSGIAMRADLGDGTWSGEWTGVAKAIYYGVQVEGPRGPGESFDASAFVGDPYARAVVSEEGPCIVIDPAETNAWFGGWSDAGYKAPEPRDMVIYETHVRDFTIDPSSRVPAALRGTFEGVLATRDTGAGLDHLKALGVNMIEFMPIQEFDTGTNAPGWGYSPEYYFAPESAYGRVPARGSQYFEFKRMVNELHRQGFGVILDVVYNHVGGVNIFGRIDRRSYFRLDVDDGYSNFSGCGNDLRTESPVMRRLIVDNILYWIKEHHVDGFRFDLAELVDMETMMAVQQAARAANPDVILIAEPWSFRGDQKQALKGTAWSAWNNQFTHPVRGFIQGWGRSDEVMKAIAGSVEMWTANPLQSINYLESHDDMALADELSSAPGRDGRNLNPADTARHRLAATLLFTSLGIPMLSEGQEFLRSKQGIRNTFDRGDVINAVRWSDRERPQAREVLAYYQGMIRLRQSPEGASLRLADVPPEGYYDWITPGSGQLLGYRINTRHEKPGRAFVVLVNAGSQAAVFTVDFPAGQWRRVGDGHAVDPAGVRVKPMQMAGGGQTQINVPALTAYVFMEGP